MSRARYEPPRVVKQDMDGFLFAVGLILALLVVFPIIGLLFVAFGVA